MWKAGILQLSETHGYLAMQFMSRLSWSCWRAVMVPRGRYEIDNILTWQQNNTDVKLYLSPNSLSSSNIKFPTDIIKSWSSVFTLLHTYRTISWGNSNKDPSTDPGNPIWLPDLILGMKHLFRISVWPNLGWRDQTFQAWRVFFLFIMFQAP